MAPRTRSQSQGATRTQGERSRGPRSRSAREEVSRMRDVAADTRTARREAESTPAAAGRATGDDMLVQIENVSKQYRLGEQIVTALDRVNLNIEDGVFMAIAGPSGSGKSTLLNLIGCIDTPSSGRIVIAGRDVSGRTPDELARLRGRSIGFIFQTFNLLPVLSAAENVEYPLLQFKELDAKERRARVEHYLGIVGLADHANHRPNQLSGGQRQRVAIARALAVRPKIILADEPTANLDHKTGMRILRLMRSINRRSGATFVFSTHDKRVIDMADRRVDLEDGEIVRLGIRKGKKEWGYALERPEPDDDPDSPTLG
jgi:putative ABC transport system ATP-binding protein